MSVPKHPKHLDQDEWNILKMGYETVIPNWLMQRKDICPTAKLFGGFIHSVTYGNGWMRLEDEFIQELSGLDIDDIIQGWSDLNEHNMIHQDIYSKTRCIQLRRG